MNMTNTITALVAACILTGGSLAQAQPPSSSPGTSPLGGKLSVDINVGAQTQSSTASTDFSFPIYAQTATVTTTAGIDGGPLFDANVGYRFMRNFGVGLGFTSFSSTSTAQGAASIPSPVFFNNPAAVTLNPVDAKHTERSVYVVVTGYVPITNVVELALFIGPSFTKVTQDVINSVTVPAGTQTAVAALGSESGTAKGVNVGADLTYKLTNLVGVGGFIRYNGGSVDLTTLTDVKAGGFQLGLGARLRF
jgi:Outer membrane protein beta-barrel domain